MKTRILLFLLSVAVTKLSWAVTAPSESEYPAEAEYFRLLDCAEQVAEGNATSDCQAYWTGKEGVSLNGALTHSDGNLYFRAKELKVDLDFSSNTIKPGESRVRVYAKADCSGRVADEGNEADFNKIKGANVRSVTCLADHEEFVSRGTDNKFGNPTKVEVPKEEFKPLSFYMDQDQKALEDYIEYYLEWNMSQWGWTPLTTYAGFPDRASRSRLQGFASISKTTESNRRAYCKHRLDGKHCNMYVKNGIETIEVNYPDPNRQCLDLGENEYQFTFSFDGPLNWHYYYPRTGKSWWLGEWYDPYNEEYVPSGKYPADIQPNASYLYSLSVGRYTTKISKNIEAVAYRKKFFYCLPNTVTEARDLYSRTEATDTCTSNGVSGDKVEYNCKGNWKENYYLPEERLVPIQVGDITTMIPYMVVNEKLFTVSSDKVKPVYTEYTATSEYQEPNMLASCDRVDTNTELGQCDSRDNPTYSTYCVAYDTHMSPDNMVGLSSKSYGGDKNLDSYCKDDSPLRIKNSMYDENGNALKYSIQPDPDGNIRYIQELDNEREWVRAQQYFNSELSNRASNYYTILKLNYNSANVDSIKQELRCLLSQEVYSIVSSVGDYDKEFYARGNSGFPLDYSGDYEGCPVGVNYYWKNIADPSNGNGDFSGIEELDEIISAINVVNEQMNGQQSVDNELEDLKLGVETYLEDVIYPFISKANAHMGTRYHVKCSELSTAIQEMYKYLVTKEIYSDQGDIPGRVVTTCSPTQ